MNIIINSLPSSNPCKVVVTDRAYADSVDFIRHNDDGSISKFHATAQQISEWPDRGEPAFDGDPNPEQNPVLIEKVSYPGGRLCLEPTVVQKIKLAVFGA